MFSSNLQHVKLQNFLSVRFKHSGLSDDAKTSKFLSYNFSQYNIEKLILTLMGISDLSKLDGRLSHTCFNLKIEGRLIKSKALLLKLILHLFTRLYPSTFTDLRFS